MKQGRKAFTLVEIIVVIALIALIASIMGGYYFAGLGEQKRKIAKAKMATIENAINRFRIDCERLPDDSETLEVLVIAPSDVEDKWKGPYLKRSELLDPWDHPYVYSQEGQINPGYFDLISYGADGRPGGEGDNEDVYND